METNSGSVFQSLSTLLLCFVLTSKTCFGSHVGLTRSESDGLRDSPLSQFSNVKGFERTTHDGARGQLIQSLRPKTAKLLKSMSTLPNEEASECDLSDTVKACYNESTQIWAVNGSILKAVKNDIQSIVQCAKDGDRIHVFSNKDIKPPRTIVIDKDIILGSESGKRTITKHEPHEMFSNVRLSCPDSGELIIAKSPSFTISNVVLKNCNGSTIIRLVPDCEEEQQQRGVVTIQNLKVEKVVVNDTNSVIDAGSATCSNLTMENIYVHEVDCGSKACFTLPPYSTLKKIELVANHGHADSSVFSAEAQTTIFAEDITAMQNKPRILSLSNSNLTLLSSSFTGNGKQHSCVDCKERCTGGAIIRAEHSTLNITNTVFIRSRSRDGGSLCLSFSKLDILNCSFRNHVIGKEGNGGAVHLFESPSVTITRTEFTQNRGSHGAALFSNGTTFMKLTRVKFWNNNSTNEGAAYVIGGEVKSKKVHFDHNKRRALVTHGVSMEVYNSTFEDNHATHGSACAMFDGSVFLADKIHVSNNSANKDVGGAFEVVHSKLQITGSQFVNNIAHSSGGAIHVHHGELIIKDTKFNKNNAGEHGGAINLLSSSFQSTKTAFKQNHGERLGGAVFIKEPITLSLKTTKFAANKGHNGGAMYILNTGKTSSDLYGLRNTHWSRTVQYVPEGGVSEIQSSPWYGSSFNSKSEDSSPGHEQRITEIIECTFEQNEATAHGGALSLMKANHLLLSDTSFEKNKGGSGGAISVNASDEVSVSGCLFSTNNVSSLGGSIYSSSSNLSISDSIFKQGTSGKSGGALYLRATTGRMSNTDITSNEAGDQCGGVCVTHHSHLDADDLSLMSNSAGSVGGGLLVDSDSTFLCYSCSIKKNKAIGGAGMYVLSGNKRFVAAQLQDSTFKSNVARDYGGGMVLDSLSEGDRSFERDNTKHGYVILLNPEFLKNKADVSGAAIMSPTLEKVLVSCNETTSKRGFLKQEEWETLKPLDEDRPCGSWEGNTLTNQTSEEGAITTSPTEPTVPPKWPPLPEPKPEASPGEAPVVPEPSESEPEASPSEAPVVPEAPSSEPEPTPSVAPVVPEVPSSEPEPTPSVAPVVPEAPSSEPEPTPSVAPVVPEVPLSEPEPSPSEVPKVPVAPGSKTTPSSPSTTEVSPRETTGHDSLSFSVDPNSDVEIIGDSKSGFILRYAKSGKRLPKIHVDIEHEDNGMPSANSEDMTIEVNSSDGFIPGHILVDIANDHGDLPRIAGFVPPGNYTLSFTPLTTGNVGNSVDQAVMTIMVRECEIGEAFNEEDRVCQECDAGSYSFNPNEPGKCNPCPKKATCEGRYIVPYEGKWHKTPCHSHMKDCIHGRACSYDNRKETLTELTRDVINCTFNESMVETYGEVQCSKGYADQLCGSCKDSHGLSSSFRCFKCPPKALSVLLIIALICYLAAIAVLVAEGYVPFDTTAVVEETPTNDVAAIIIEGHTPQGASRRSIGMPDEEVPPPPPTQDEITRNPEDRLQVEIARITLTENLKILFNFLQTISLAALIDVRWTNGMIGMLRFTDHISAASLGSVYWPLSCVFSSSSAGDRAIGRMVLSLLIPVFAFVVAIVLWTYFARKAKGGSLLSRLKLGIVVVIYISYIALTKVAIGSFYCVDVNDSLDPFSNSESKYWALDTSMKCMKGSHSTVVVLAIASLILITVCFPIISSLAALGHANDASAESSAWIFGPLSFLYTAFKRELVLWETLTMMRKVVLVVIVVFAYPLGGRAQGVLAFLVLICSHYFQTAYRPYRNEIDSLNTYESRSLLICSLVFAVSLFFDIEKCSEAVRCCASIVVVVLILAFVIFLLYMFVKNVFEAMKAILQYKGYYVTEGTSASRIEHILMTTKVVMNKGDSEEKSEYSPQRSFTHQGSFFLLVWDVVRVLGSVL